MKNTSITLKIQASSRIVVGDRIKIQGPAPKTTVDVGEYARDVTNNKFAPNLMVGMVCQVVGVAGATRTRKRMRALPIANVPENRVLAILQTNAMTTSAPLPGIRASAHHTQDEPRQTHMALAAAATIHAKDMHDGEKERNKKTLSTPMSPHFLFAPRRCWNFVAPEAIDRKIDFAKADANTGLTAVAALTCPIGNDRIRIPVCFSSDAKSRSVALFGVHAHRVHAANGLCSSSPLESFLIWHVLFVSKIKPCMSKYTKLYSGETANGPLN